MVAGHRQTILLVAGVVAVTGAYGCGSDSSAELRANFTARFEQATTGPTTCPVTAIHFTDRSSGEPTRWYWTFDGDSSSTARSPTWKTRTHSAEVTLRIQRGDQEDRVTKTISTTYC